MKRPHQQGAALILALSITVVALIVIVGIVQSVIPFMLQSSYFASSNESYFASEAAIENALYDRSEHAQGYESVGPNSGIIPVAQNDTQQPWIAYIPRAGAASLLSANADDMNFRTVAACTASSRPSTYPTELSPSCEFYNNDPFRYDFGTCCTGANLATYQQFCADGVRKFGLDRPSVSQDCFAGRETGSYDAACIEDLITYSGRNLQRSTPQICSNPALKGTSAQSGYAIQGMTTVIPRPGEGTSPSTIEQAGALIQPRDWNKIDLENPLLIHLARENNPDFGQPVEDSDIVSAFGGTLCVPELAAPSSNLEFFVRLPLLHTIAQLNNYLYDGSSSYNAQGGLLSGNTLTKGTGNDVVLRWQVSGYHINTDGSVDKTKSYTLFAVNTTQGGQQLTDIFEEDINRLSRETLSEGKVPGRDTMISALTLLTRGTPDLAFQGYYGGRCGGSTPPSMSIYQFMQSVHDPVLKITMVANPPLRTNAILKPPYLEYQVRTTGAAPAPLANVFSIIQGVGQTSRTEAKQFTQTIETKIRNDVAAPILDFTIFQ